MDIHDIEINIWKMLPNPGLRDRSAGDYAYRCADASCILTSTGTSAREARNELIRGASDGTFSSHFQRKIIYLLHMDNDGGGSSWIMHLIQDVVWKRRMPNIKCCGRNWNSVKTDPVLVHETCCSLADIKYFTYNIIISTMQMLLLQWSSHSKSVY